MRSDCASAPHLTDRRPRLICWFIVGVMSTIFCLHMSNMNCCINENIWQCLCSVSKISLHVTEHNEPVEPHRANRGKITQYNIKKSVQSQSTWVPDLSSQSRQNESSSETFSLNIIFILKWSASTRKTKSQRLVSTCENSIMYEHMWAPIFHQFQTILTQNSDLRIICSQGFTSVCDISFSWVWGVLCRLVSVCVFGWTR